MCVRQLNFLVAMLRKSCKHDSTFQVEICVGCGKEQHRFRRLLADLMNIVQIWKQY